MKDNIVAKWLYKYNFSKPNGYWTFNHTLSIYFIKLWII